MSSKDDVNATQAAIRAAATGEGDPSLIGVDAALADLIKRGEFSAYHLARAKKMMAEGDHKGAAYQASAALSHDPANAEALDLRNRARQQSKT